MPSSPISGARQSRNPIKYGRHGDAHARRLQPRPAALAMHAVPCTFRSFRILSTSSSLLAPDFFGGIIHKLYPHAQTEKHEAH